jgi:hypothetical protein
MGIWYILWSFSLYSPFWSFVKEKSGSLGHTAVEMNTDTKTSALFSIHGDGVMASHILKCEI